MNLKSKSSKLLFAILPNRTQLVSLRAAEQQL